MDWQAYIDWNPNVAVGKPVFKGTRIGVELVLERLGDGWTEKQLIESYPALTPEHFRAAQLFAAHTLSGSELLATKAS